MGLALGLSADEFGFYGLANENRHAVWSRDRLNTPPLLVRQANLRFFDVHRRTPHPSGAIRPRKICQSHSLPSPLIDVVSVPGYVSGDAYGDKS